MAAVVMENYDPEFAGLIEPGDVLVSGYNFGTGSSREQAATALQAAGISLVIAGSYSQTYLRNAINNGFICIECPAFVDALKVKFVDRSAQRTLVTTDEIALDFGDSVIVWGDKKFAFTPLGAPVQEVVIAGGVENQVRASL